jgi:hypothetical protein
MRIFLFSTFLLLTGCHTSTGPDVLLLDSSQYAVVFDAAVAAARQDGMNPVLKDRRSGVISTEPAVAGSFVEPWKPDPSTSRQGLENTLSLQRRSARFEFLPAQNIPVPGRDNAVLVGPNLLSPSGQDLTTYDGELELRVWVYVERKYTQGVQRGTWTLQSESITQIMPAQEPWEQVPGEFWAPISRDVAREQQLLGAVETSLQQE